MFQVHLNIALLWVWKTQQVSQKAGNSQETQRPTGFQEQHILSICFRELIYSIRSLGFHILTTFFSDLYSDVQCVKPKGNSGRSWVTKLYLISVLTFNLAKNSVRRLKHLLQSPECSPLHQGTPFWSTFFKLLRPHKAEVKKQQWQPHWFTASATVSHSVMSDSETPWTAAHQAPLSMGFSRQESWSSLPFPSPGDLSNPGIETGSPALQADSLPSEPPDIISNFSLLIHLKGRFIYKEGGTLLLWITLNRFLSILNI